MEEENEGITKAYDDKNELSKLRKTIVRAEKSMTGAEAEERQSSQTRKDRALGGKGKMRMPIEKLTVS